MSRAREVIDQFFELARYENAGQFTEEEQSIYNVFLDGLSLDDPLGLEARKKSLTVKLERVIDLLEPHSGQVILDAGCGIGNQAFMFALLGLGKIVAVDVHEKRLALARRRKEILEGRLGRKFEIDFLNDDIFRLALSEKWDMIYCKDSISHIHPLETFISTAAQSLKAGGLFIVDEPNTFNPIILQHALRQHYRVSGSLGYYTNEVVNPATGSKLLEAQERMTPPFELKRMLRKNGLSEIKAWRGGGWLIPKTTIAKATRSHSMEMLGLLWQLERLIAHLPVANLFFGTYLMAGRKRV